MNLYLKEYILKKEEDKKHKLYFTFNKNKFPYKIDAFPYGYDYI